MRVYKDGDIVDPYYLQNKKFHNIFGKVYFIRRYFRPAIFYMCIKSAALSKLYL